MQVCAGTRLVGYARLSVHTFMQSILAFDSRKQSREAATADRSVAAVLQTLWGMRTSGHAVNGPRPVPLQLDVWASWLALSMHLDLPCSLLAFNVAHPGCCTLPHRSLAVRRCAVHRRTLLSPGRSVRRPSPCTFQHVLMSVTGFPPGPRRQRLEGLQLTPLSSPLKTRCLWDGKHPGLKSIRCLLTLHSPE
jgi:hypothetical protein